MPKEICDANRTSIRPVPTLMMIADGQKKCCEQDSFTPRPPKNMGCASGKAQPASPIVAFSRAIEAVPWGVLGDAQVSGGTPWQTKRVAPKPDGQTLFVDPASIAIVADPHFRPGDAGGAAGAIYEFLGISANDSFPSDVAAQLRGVGDAVYKRYGYPHAVHVIHAIGPDFKRESVTEDEAITMVATAYASVLRVAAREPRPLLRLCPISSGIYAGPHRPRMAQITARALVLALQTVADEVSAAGDSQGRLLPGGVDGCARVELCLFEGLAAVADYGKALHEELRREVERVRV